MDYDKMEILTIQMKLGQPAFEFIRVLDDLDRELPDLQKVTMSFDERTETHEATLVFSEHTRTATIVGIENASVP